MSVMQKVKSTAESLGFVGVLLACVSIIPGTIYIGWLAHGYTIDYAVSNIARTPSQVPFMWRGLSFLVAPLSGPSAILVKVVDSAIPDCPTVNGVISTETGNGGCDVPPAARIN